MSLEPKTKLCLKDGLANKPAAEEVIAILESSQGSDHSHANKAVLDLISAAFTTALKSTYDGYAAQISAKVSKNAVNGTFITADLTPLTITVVDGQITSIA